MIVNFFSMWGVAFWILTLMEVLLLFYFIEDGRGGMSFFSVLLYLGVLHVFGNANLYAFVVENPYKLCLMFVFYMLAGFAWSICKFYFEMKKIANKIRRYKDEWSKKSERNRLDGWRNDENRFLRAKLGTRTYEKVTSFGENRGKILFWMSYWPISMLWTLLNDPLKDFFMMIYDQYLVGVYRRIHEKIVVRAFNGEV